MCCVEWQARKWYCPIPHLKRDQVCLPWRPLFATAGETVMETKVVRCAWTCWLAQSHLGSRVGQAAKRSKRAGGYKCSKCGQVGADCTGNTASSLAVPDSLFPIQPKSGHVCPYQQVVVRSSPQVQHEIGIQVCIDPLMTVASLNYCLAVQGEGNPPI